MCWKNSAVSFTSHKQKLLLVEIQHKAVYSITGGEYNLLRQWGESSCALLSVAFYPSSWKHLYEGCLAPGLGKEIRPVQSGRNKGTTQCCRKCLLCYHLATSFSVMKKVRDRTYYTLYFIAFASDIFSVWWKCVLLFIFKFLCQADIMLCTLWEKYSRDFSFFFFSFTFQRTSCCNYWQVAYTNSKRMLPHLTPHWTFNFHTIGFFFFFFS